MVDRFHNRSHTPGDMPEDYMERHDPRQFDIALRERANIGDASQPLGTEDNPLIVSRPAGLGFGGTYEVPGQWEVNVLRLRYQQPKEVTAYIALDLNKNPQYAGLGSGLGGGRIITAVSGIGPLHMLCKLRHGLQGTIVETFFDAPLGQIIQIPMVVESLDITAHLITVPSTDAEFQNPPTSSIAPQIAGIPGGAAIPVQVTSVAGAGFSGVCNAKRVFYLRLGVAGSGTDTITISCPNLCTSYRLRGSSQIQYFLQPDNQLANAANPGPFALNDTIENTFPEGMTNLRIQNLDAANTHTFVAEFRLGYFGNLTS